MGEPSSWLTRPVKSGRAAAVTQLAALQITQLKVNSNRIIFIIELPFQLFPGEGSLHGCAEPLALKIASHDPALCIEQEDRGQRVHVKCRRHPGAALSIEVNLRP